MAIPDDELARLGLSASSSEAPEAAQLFWAGEELVAIGDGRFYPCRQIPLPIYASLISCWDQRTHPYCFASVPTSDFIPRVKFWHPAQQIM